MCDNNNVVLFPKWKTELEEESLAALRAKRYEEALEKLNKLINYQVANHEILIGKLICLMELGYLDDAQDLCEDLIAHKGEHYYQYLHIYLTLLFQTSQYEELMEQIEAECQTDNIPPLYKDQFKQLYDMSEKMNHQQKELKLDKYIKVLLKAVEESDYEKQWLFLKKIRSEKIKPKLALLTPLLISEQIHPVIKTSLFQLLQEMDVSEPVTIHKLNHNLTVVPNSVVKYDEHSIVKQTKLQIGGLEQENPTLYMLVEKLLLQYSYVRYPVMPPDEDVTIIARALMAIGKERLNLPIKDHSDQFMVQEYKEQIERCEKLYLFVIDE